jgi:hypothetical protein
MYKEYDVDIEFIPDDDDDIETKIYPLIIPEDNYTGCGHEKVNFKALMKRLGISTYRGMKTANERLYYSGIFEFNIKEKDGVSTLEFIYNLHKTFVLKFPEMKVNLNIDTLEYDNNDPRGDFCNKSKD